MVARFGNAQNGRRIRLGKRVTGAAAAFTALAALTGSQVTGLGLASVAAADAATTPGTNPTTQGDDRSGAAATPANGPSTGSATGPGTGVPADGGGTVQLPQPPTTLPGAPTAGPFAATGPALPATVFAAYRQAETAAAQRSPGCHLPWQLLAGIGQVESGHANGGQVDAAGTTFTPILGPVLDGNGFAAIPDTDNGRYDGDPRWDRAVGPMQFIPSTWATWGADANGDGKADPNNVFDAADAAARYLCAGGRDLADPAQLDRAVLSYNNSGEYLRTVRNWMAHYGSGTTTSVPDRPAPSAPLWPTPALPLPVPSTATTTPGGTPAPTTAPVSQPSPSAQPTTPAPSPTATPTAQPTTAQPTTSTPTTSTPTTSTPTPTGSPSPSATATTTPTGTPSPTATPTTTPTPTGTPTACPSPTATTTAAPTGTATPTGTPSPTATPTATATPTGTPTATPTTPGCPTPTPTATTTTTPSGSATAIAPSASPSPSAH
ncbi:lytic murein transglycosylase [Kitasatospora sp. NPDC097643]|uniref:lytic transglycosylase domain-containing protein n=1 Tax=Kitasatospora sp. NPDC097643 TaxID=3157230 RepID=UPI00331B8058